SRGRSRRSELRAASGRATDVSPLDRHSLELLEFSRVAAGVAALAASPAGRARVADARPLADAAARDAGHALPAEAIRRGAEPGAWAHVGRDDVAALLEGEAAIEDPLDGPALRVVASWIEAGRLTAQAWQDGEVAARHPALASRVRELPQLVGLERAL